MKRFKDILITLAFLVILAIGFICFAAWAFNSPAVDLGDLNLIREGMSKSEIERILGAPDEETAAHNDSGFHWRYKHPLKWYALRIDFTENGEVIRYIHDD
jgi:hypothetical protein